MRKVTSSQHSLGVGVGHVAHRTVSAGSPIAGMDRLVVSLHGGVAGSYDLALQQHGEELIRRDSVSRQQQCELATVPELRFTLGSAIHRPDHRIRGRDRHSRMGTTNVSSIQKGPIVGVGAGDHPIKYLRSSRKYADFKCPYRGACGLRSSDNLRRLHLLYTIDVRIGEMFYLAESFGFLMKPK